MQQTLIDYGFIRTAAALPRVKPGAVDFNTRESRELMRLAAKKGAVVTVFPELGLSGYTCADLFQQELLLGAVEDAAAQLIAGRSKGNSSSALRLEGGAGSTTAPW